MAVWRAGFWTYWFRCYVSGNFGLPEPYYQNRRARHSFTIPIINARWKNRELSPADYNDGRRKLLLLSIKVKDGISEIYTLSSCKNVYPVRGSDLRAILGNRNKLGRRGPRGSTSERYERSTCIAEQQKRADILKGIDACWKPAPSPDLPTNNPLVANESVVGGYANTHNLHVVIGDDPDTVDAKNFDCTDVKKVQEITNASTQSNRGRIGMLPPSGGVLNGESGKSTGKA